MSKKNSSYFANSSVLDPIRDEITTSRTETTLYATAWGWNANHRKHHSLLLSDHGIIYSFGDGRQGQLGYGNLFTGNPIKGGIVQATPASVTPTGNLKFGRDLQCAEVVAGGTFSIAREASPEEGAKRVVGFLSLEKRLMESLKFFPDSSALRRAWSLVRQERFAINRISEGLVISWGTGANGELGHGKDVKHTPYPLPQENDMSWQLIDRDICSLGVVVVEVD
eukprot:scaffold1504_cov172-Ochromonas_danica.AAC.5